MRRLLPHLLVWASALLLLGVGADNSVLVAAVAIATIALAARVLVSAAPRSLTVGARATSHREPLSETPEPSHPSTAGRPLGRAPTPAIAAA